MSNTPQSSGKEMDYMALLWTCLRHWYWFVACAVVCCGAAYFYLLHQTPKYAVNSTIMIRNDRQNNVPQADVLQVMGFSLNKEVKDEAAIIRSRTIMEQAVRALGLQTEYRKKRGFRWVGQYPTPDVLLTYEPGYLDTIRIPVSVQIERRAKDYRLEIRKGKAEESFVLQNLADPLPTVAGELSFMEIHPLKEGDLLRITTHPVEPVAAGYRAALGCAVEGKYPNISNIITISMVSDVPARACDIISKVVELYNMDAVIDKNIMATNTGNFINERLAIVTMELDTVEQAVEDYMKSNKVTDIERELALAMTTQSTYQTKLFDIETQINLLTYIDEYLREERNQESLIPSNMGVTDQSLIALIKEYNSLMLDRMRISRSATASSPLLIQTDEQLSTLRSSILSSISNLRQGLEITKQDLTRQDTQYASLISRVPAKERRYMEIKRQQEIKEQLYIYLYKKREENALTLASTVMPAKVIDAPRVAGGTVSPHYARIMGVALLVGLGLPFVLFFLLVYINDEIRDKREFQQVVKAPFLGSIAHCKGNKSVVVGPHTNSASAEFFRTIRTNMKFMLPDGKSPVILVTSALNGEGKSFVAINTAISLALLKKRVVLVGLDIRKPTLSSYLEMDFRGAVTTYLSDASTPIEDLITPSGVVEGLDVAPAGIIPPNPGELIQSARMAELFSELRARYDYIVVDTAPVSLVSDTYHLNRYADMTLFVTRANYLSRDMLPVIQEIYEQQRLTNMACVLNGVTGGKRGYGYGRYSYGRYGYGYGHYGQYGYGYYGHDDGARGAR